MVKANDLGPRGPQFDSYESLQYFSMHSMDVMINSPMTCPTLNRLQKYDGQTENKHSSKPMQVLNLKSRGELSSSFGVKL